ncbi:hypothetical protein LCGC14_0752450 [marine sediment metagenome]|uniref:Phage ABA sandwich domain-containing protein n=1 Tax=marine sediment metagenome TaxID=412755 RepID=A0A0F9Q3J7_9ZZZZ
MTDNEVTEAYFRAMGWKRFKDRRDDGSGHGRNENVTGWVDSDGEEWYDLPNILESNSAYIREVADVMEGEGCRLFIWQPATDPYSVVWSIPDLREGCNKVVGREPVIKNNTSRAAVIAATRYFEEKSK